MRKLNTLGGRVPLAQVTLCDNHTGMCVYN
jgi:hypothetical protein